MNDNNEQKWKRIPIALLVTVSVVLASLSCSSELPKTIWHPTGSHKEKKLNSKLLHQQPNLWVKLSNGNDSGWHRQEHAGAAYDSKRGVILIFGSDTHGIDWDNEIHEFDPVTEKWTTC